EELRTLDAELRRRDEELRARDEELVAREAEIGERNEEMARLKSDRQGLVWRAGELEAKETAMEAEAAALRESLKRGEDARRALGSSADQHATEMRSRAAELAERDAYIEELRAEVASLGTAKERADSLVRAEIARADRAEGEA